MDRRTAGEILGILRGAYPGAMKDGRYHAPAFEALITTILSAQTTDRSVDLVRGRLFGKYPTPEALSRADTASVEEIIHSTGFYHAKARHIIAASKSLITDFGGTVPRTMEELVRIPGVGRKTANIVLYHVYGKNDGVAVDTHVMRLSGRIGLSDRKDQDGIERDLMALFPEDAWGPVTDLLIAHGRAVCTARKPDCGRCIINRFCRYYHETFLPQAGRSS
ncbi:MAG: endonuclease III [Methanoregulaceae archaeon]|nr:endonuclease III [Methanoregulaceae archaeon]